MCPSPSRNRVLRHLRNELPLQHPMLRPYVTQDDQRLILASLGAPIPALSRRAPLYATFLQASALPGPKKPSHSVLSATTAPSMEVLRNAVGLVTTPHHACTNNTLSSTKVLKNAVGLVTKCVLSWRSACLFFPHTALGVRQPRGW